MIFRIEKEVASNKILRDISFKSLVLELPNLVLILFSALQSDSLIIWVDVLGSLNSELHSAIVYFATKNIEKNSGNFYSFDIPRLEILTSLFSDTLMIIGYFILIFTAFYDMFFYTLLANEWVLFYLVIKGFDTLVDFYFYISQKKIYDNNPSSINETELANWKNNAIIDVILGTLSIITFMLVKHKWNRYINSIASILLSIYFVYGSIIRLTKSFNELINTSISLPKQDMIIDVLLKNRSECLEKVEDVKCYYVDHTLNINLKLVFKKETTYEEQTKLLKVWIENIKNIYKDSVVHAEIAVG